MDNAKLNDIMYECMKELEEELKSASDSAAELEKAAASAASKMIDERHVD